MHDLNGFIMYKYKVGFSIVPFDFTMQCLQSGFQLL